MKVSMFLSVDKSNWDGVGLIGRQVAMACASHKLAANVTPIFSSIPDSNYGTFHTEQGARIDILSDLPHQRADDVLYLFKRLQDMLKIECIWLDITGPIMSNYSGCILDWSHYRKNWDYIHDKYRTCSCCPKTEPTSDKLRNGKPLC